MAEKSPYGSQPGREQPVKIIDNPPQKTVAAALASAKQQVSKAK